MHVVFAAGLVAFLVVLLPGNLLVLAPPLCVWAHVVLAFPKRSGKRGALHAREVRLPPAQQRIRIFTLVLWVAALAIGGYRLAQTPLATGQELGRQMAEAETLFHTGDPCVALEAFRAIEVPEALPQRRAQKFHNIGVISMHLERWEDAETAFREAVRYDPADFDAHYALARLAVRKKAFSAAIGHLSAAVNLEPRHTGAWLLAAQCLMEAGEYEQALVAIRRAEALATPDSQIRLQIADLKKRIEFRASLFD